MCVCNTVKLEDNKRSADSNLMLRYFVTITETNRQNCSVHFHFDLNVRSGTQLLETEASKFHLVWFTIFTQFYR